MSKKYKVSAIVSTYKSEEFIRGKIEDLLNQSLKEKLEIIIVNSGSPQNEDAIIKEYLSKHKNIKYIHTPERETIYKAWNRGIAVAKGEYITNSNTDDRLRRDAFEVMAKTLDDNPHIALVYGDQIISSVPNETFENAKSKKFYNRPDYSRMLLLNGYLAGSQSMWRNSLHTSDKLSFNENLEIVGDYDFALQISELYDFLHIPKVLGVYYKSDKNSNKELQNITATQDEGYSVQMKYIDNLVTGLDKIDTLIVRRHIARIVIIPRLFYSVISLLISFFSPSKQVLGHEFLCIVGAKIALKTGDFKKAKKYLRHHKNSSKGIYSRKLFDELSHSGIFK